MKKIVVKRMVIMMILCMIITAFPACGADQNTSGQTNDGATTSDPVETIKIGITQPFGGTSASAAANIRAGEELALEIINNSYPDLDFPFAATEGIPNLGGAKLEIIWGDNKASSQDAMSETERLINAGAVMIGGASYSGPVAASSEVCERHGIPFINDNASSPALNERGYQWYFSICPDDKDFAEMFFTFFEDMKKEGKKIETLGLIYMNSAFGMDGADAIKELAKEKNYKIVADLMYDSKTTNLTGEIQKLKVVDPDVLIPISNVTDAVLMMKTMKDFNYTPNCILAQNSGFTDRELIKMLGENSEYLMTRDLYSPELGKDNPTIKKITDMFYEKNGYYMTGQSSRSFQAMFVFADVLNRTKSLSPEDLRDAIKATDLKSEAMFMPWEGIKFDERGKNNYARGIITMVKDGIYVPVWPADVATEEIVWPLPPWEERD